LAHRIVDPRIEAAFLLLLADLEPQLDQDHAGIGHPPLELGDVVEKALDRVVRGEAEHARVKLPKRSKKGAYDDALDPEKVRFVRAAY
jgi:hypothetical protein